MNILLDSNVLLRLTDPTSASHGIALTAVASLRAQGDVLYIVPQCVYEFWVVAGRPIAKNGLGLSVAECIRELAHVEMSFPLLDDKPMLYTEWKTLVMTFGCQGKVAHDARYVAAMRTYGLSHLLTFNVGDFARYPGLVALDPNTIAASAPQANTP
ncbi:MAG: PIN domain nuclease [Planctomycetes bacterium]|nr:PIN domain nuclease [Planctomycetota bacterium]